MGFRKPSHLFVFSHDYEGANVTATRSGISTGREEPVALVPEPVLPFRN